MKPVLKLLARLSMESGWPLTVGIIVHLLHSKRSHIVETCLRSTGDHSQCNSPSESSIGPLLFTSALVLVVVSSVTLVHDKRYGQAAAIVSTCLAAIAWSLTLM